MERRIYIEFRRITWYFFRRAIMQARRLNGLTLHLHFEIRISFSHQNTRTLSDPKKMSCKRSQSHPAKWLFVVRIFIPSACARLCSEGFGHLFAAEWLRVQVFCEPSFKKPIVALCTQPNPVLVRIIVIWFSKEAPFMRSCRDQKQSESSLTLFGRSRGS
jgi:hypothetical protein